MSETLDIHLLGKDYRVACAPAERDALAAAVAFLDDKLKSIGGKTPQASGGARSSSERIAVMAALNIAHELLTLKNATPDLFVGLENETIQRRMNSIESKLNQSLAIYQSPLP
ncbi:MAG: cell division protein ZapA [Rugosibacter sp.]|nr:MAG: cell division protein ZapA [Rugosibacter sp.]TBR10436.1 MAG: cell division protein ZapA [Rugosibacter sp.]